MVTCVVCKHAHRVAMEADYAAGRLKGLRERYGVHHMALMQHMRAHVSTPAALLPEQSCADDLPRALVRPGDEPATLLPEQSGDADAAPTLRGSGDVRATLLPEQCSADVQPTKAQMIANFLASVEDLEANRYQRFTDSVQQSLRVYRESAGDTRLQARMRAYWQQQLQPLWASEDL